MRLNRLVIWVLITAAFYQCTLGPVENEEPVARVYDRYLYKSDLKKIVPVTASDEDSVQIVEKYINKWLHDNVLIAQAELNLTIDQEELEKKLDQYRNSLLVYSYEQALIDEKLDTHIAILSIVNYYSSHEEIFKLNEKAFKLRYVRLAMDEPEKDQVSKWLKSEKEEDKEELILFCENRSSNYFLSDSLWISAESLEDQIPDNSAELIETLDKTGFKEWNDGRNDYLFYVSELLVEGEQAPVDLVKDEIRSMILNKRKVDLLKKMRKDIYTEALRKKNVERYSR